MYKRSVAILVSLFFFPGSSCILNAQAQAQRKTASPAKSSAALPGTDITPAAKVEGPSVAESARGAAARLPVRRVVLYKNGVGYFEHLGRVRGNQDVSIDFTSGQLNDVLKSLTTLDLGNGRITGVGYNSDAPLTRRLSALRLSLGAETTVAHFLSAMRGARLEVRSGTASITGRLLSVERKTRISGGTTLEVDHISLIADTGEVRTVELSPAVSVRVIERDLNTEVGRYLNLISSARQQDLRRMVISTAGAGERPLFVSYISEVPVWKTTYRLVLPSKPGAKPLLQGWAIVDNTVGEDWENVQLSLVAGAPQSFIQQLSQPYYSRRPVVPLPESVQLTPQTHQATLAPGTGQLNGKVTDETGATVADAQVRVYDENNQLIGETTSDDNGNYEFNSLPVGNHRVEVQSSGFKTINYSGVNVAAGLNVQNANLSVASVSETVMVQSSAAKVGAGSYFDSRKVSNLSLLAPGVAGNPYSPYVAEARMRGEAAAKGQGLGDLFEYKLKEPVTIRKNQSALVPIVQTDIAAEKVSLWNEAAGSPRPLRGVWLTNSSTLTLDGGSFSVLEDETFAGEGLIDPMKPSEKRLLSYAIDLGVLVDTKQESERQQVTRVRIARGVITQTREIRERKTYTIRNEDTSARTVVIEHAVRPGWKLAKELSPAETTPAFHRFRVSAEPKTTTALVVNESHVLDSTFAVSNVTDDQITVFLRQREINAQVERALRRIVAQKNVVAEFQNQVNARQAQIQRIFEDQQRVRENMKALKGSSEEKALLERYTRQLNEQENKLDILRSEIAQLGEKRQAAQTELNAMIEQLSLDVTL